MTIAQPDEAKSAVDEMDRGRFSRPIRMGEEVHRRPMHDNTEVHRLLEHLEAVGFELAPRFLGVTDEGIERLSYIEGQTGYPPLPAVLRSNEALQNVARAIKRFHDASQSFIPTSGDAWNGYEFARPARFDCIGHHDLAPWNMIFNGTEVVGIIDWDSAGPSSRVWDLAYAAHQFVPFHATEGLAAWGWEQVPDRRGRLRLFLDAYDEGLSAEELVDTAVLRIYGIGAYLDRQVRSGNPAFSVQATEGHASAFMRAGQSIFEMRDELI